MALVRQDGRAAGVGFPGEAPPKPLCLCRCSHSLELPGLQLALLLMHHLWATGFQGT